MKSVLILANHDVGLYNFRAELIERLIREGIDVRFSVPFGEKVILLEQLGAVYHPVELNRRGKNPLQDLRLLAYYLKLIRSVKPCAVLTYTAKPNIYGGLACRMMDVPQLANITGLGSELQQNGGTAKLLRFLYWVGLHKAQRVFFQNETNHWYFLSHGLANASQAAILPGSGVNTERYRLLKGKTFSDTGSARFLYISRIMRDKGIKELLTAAVGIKAQHPETRFELLGFYESDEYRSEIESLQNQGIIDAVTFSSDTRIQMRDADCVVLPSYHEGMSNVLLEAAASGIPVITTDIPGCREAVVDGLSGYLCNVKDAEDLQAKMEQFIGLTAEEKAAMGIAGRKLMVERFDRNIVIDAYLQSIHEVPYK